MSCDCKHDNAISRFVSSQSRHSNVAARLFAAWLVVLMYVTGSGRALWQRIALSLGDWFKLKFFEYSIHFQGKFAIISVEKFFCINVGVLIYAF